MGYLEAILKSILLGTVQGLTEFLPVSSSGHLSLLQRVLGFGMDGGSMTLINVLLHLGTLFAVLFAFRRDVFALFRRPFKPLFLLVFATVPAALVGVLAGDAIDEIFAGERGLVWLGIAFLCTAALLAVCEIAAKRQKRLQPLGWKNAAAMGLMQAVALFPGISRSGSTIAAGTLSGAKREDVAVFSFLMSIPVILGSVVLEAIGLAAPQETAVLSGPVAAGMAAGVVFSAAFGLLSVKLMQKAVLRANYKWFSAYLVLLSLVCFHLHALALF